MATLTISVDDRGAFGALRRLDGLLATTIRSTERLAAVASTIGRQFKLAGDTIGTHNRSLQTAQREAIKLAGIGKTYAQQFQQATGASQQLTRSLGESQRAAIATAGASKTIAAHLDKDADAARRLTGELVRAGRAAQTIRGGGVGGAGGALQPLPTRVPGGGGGFSTFAGRLGGFGQSVLSGAPGIIGSTAGGAFTGGGIGAALGPLGGLGGAVIGGFAGAASSITKTVFEAVKAGLSTAIDFGLGALKVGLGAVFAASAAVLGASIANAVKREPIAGGFGSIVADRGLGDQAEVLDRLRTAAKNTVSDLDLMTQTNRALFLGAAQTTEELELLIEGGRRLGKAMGRDAKEGFEDLALGIGRQSKLILDNLGIIVKVEEAQDAYAKSVGTTSAALSDQEKQLVFQQAAFDAVRAKMKSLGDEQETTGDKLGRLRSSFSNLTADIGERLIPALGSALDRATAFLSTLDADRVIGFAKTAGDAIKSAFTTAFDFVFGDGATSNLGGAFASLKDAIANPSRDAWQIVKLEGLVVFEDLKAGFQHLWEAFKDFAREGWNAFIKFGADSIRRVAEGIGRFIPGLGLGALALGATVEGLGTIDAGPSRSAEIDSARESRQGELRREIEALRGAMDRNTDKIDEGILISTRGAASAGVGAVAAASPAAAGGSAGALTRATADRVEAENVARAAAEAERVTREAAAEAVRAEEAERRNLLSIIQRETSERERNIAELVQATIVAGRAKEGLDAPRTLAERLREASSELVAFPRRIEEAGFRVAAAQEALAAVTKRNAEEMRSVVTEFRARLKQEAAGFLLGDPQDGETVRVRAIKRRARRDVRRQNSRTINDAFRSTGFEDAFGGAFGGGLFGAGAGGGGLFGLSGSNSLVGQAFPALEQAIAGLVDQSGASLLTEQVQRVAQLAAQQTEALKAQEAATADAVAEQAALEQEQIELAKKQTDLMRQAIDEIAKSRSQVEGLRADVDRIDRDLVRIGRNAKTR